jgi:hypothetical protein
LIGIGCTFDYVPGMSTERQAVVAFFDNSLSSLNDDFPPTRLTAQADTIEVLAQLYLDGHPESVFGYSVLAGCAFRAPARPEAVNKHHFIVLVAAAASQATELTSI